MSGGSCRGEGVVGWGQLDGGGVDVQGGSWLGVDVRGYLTGGGRCLGVVARGIDVRGVLDWGGRCPGRGVLSGVDVQG